jgi:hypothetical protein
MHQDEILLQIVNRLDRTDRELKRLTRRLEQAIDAGTGTEPPVPPPAPRPGGSSERPPIRIPAP